MGQMIKMPARTDAEPFVLDMDLTTTCSSASESECPALQLEVGPSISRVMIGGGGAPVSETVSICLGDAAYGGEIPLKIRPSLVYRYGTRAFACGATDWPQIEGLRIRPAEAGECPSPSAALGSLAGPAGWDLDGTVTFSGNEIPTLSGTASTTVHVRAGAGLAVTVGGTNTMMLVEGLDHTYVMKASSTQCLPTWTQGGVARISFRPLFAGAKLTSFGVMPDSSCNTPAFDRSFERESFSRSWDTASGDPFVVPSGATAFDGSQVLRASSAVDVIGVTRMPLLDDSGDGLAFTARRRVVNPAATLVEGSYSAQLGVSLSFTTSATSWSSIDLACLDRAWEGQLISIHLRASAQVTSGSGTPAYLLLDDVGPATSGSCN
jgi:hypothetical protein